MSDTPDYWKGLAVANRKVADDALAESAALRVHVEELTHQAKVQDAALDQLADKWAQEQTRAQAAESRAEALTRERDDAAMRADSLALRYHHLVDGAIETENGWIIAKTIVGAPSLETLWQAIDSARGA